MLAWMMLLVGAALTLWSLWQFRRWLAEAEASTAAGPRRLEALVDELLATAETTTSVVQEKSEALAALIAEADKRVAALGSVRAPGGVAGPVGAPMSVPVSAPVSVPVSVPVSAPVSVPVSVPGGLPVEPAAAVQEEAPDEPEAPSAAPPAPAGEPAAGREGGHLGRAREYVWQLADLGMDEASIARELGLARGEVQLILGMRRMQ